MCAREPLKNKTRRATVNVMEISFFAVKQRQRRTWILEGFLEYCLGEQRIPTYPQRAFDPCYPALLHMPNRQLVRTQGAEGLVKFKQKII